jgi:hypothetical protein
MFKINLIKSVYSRSADNTSYILNDCPHDVQNFAVGFCRGIPH